MPVITDIVHTPGRYSSEQLKINFHKRTATANINALSFIDKDTKQHIFYFPAFEITGYGETHAKALEMAKFCINDFIAGLLGLPESKAKQELSILGWKRSNLFHKEYSKAFVDGNGELKNFNAENDKVERVTLSMA